VERFFFIKTAEHEKEKGGKRASLEENAPFLQHQKKIRL